MKTAARGNPETGFDRVAFWLGSGIAAWLVSIVLLHVFYVLVPAKPTPAVLRIEKEAAQRPFLTENGFRLAGLLAPAGSDPVAFGRCLYAETVEQVEAHALDVRYTPPSREEQAARLTQCLAGQPSLNLSPAIAEAKAGPGWTLENWGSLGDQAPDPVVLERALSIWGAGPRGLGDDFWSPTVDRVALSRLAQWRVAQGVKLWLDGSRPAALQTWASSGKDALVAADGLLFEASLSTSEMSRLLLAMHAATQASDRISDDEAMEMLKVASMADQMPEIVHKAMLSDWQSLARTHRTVFQGEVPAPPENDGVGQAIFRTVLITLRAITWDPVDTVNQFTAHFEQERERVISRANGQNVTRPKNTPGGAWMDNGYRLLWRPYERNPLGRFIVELEAPDYDGYGSRVADLRNLAAATRLTIEARRQGLQGEALARFVAEAPDHMRDIFTRQPFQYDLAQRSLTIELRAKSPVLGERTYTLPL
jgi:hypothetical protein